MSEITKVCRLTNKSFTINEWEQGVLDRFALPLPTICIEERHRQRLAHRNERNIYRDVCDLTGKPIISLYSPEKKVKVCAPEVWWSDSWDAKTYGRDFDFNRPFFEQFQELRRVVPRCALFNIRGENSEYCNFTNSHKNCYLEFGGEFDRDCIYSCFTFHCENCTDCYWVNKSTLCYECVDCTNCYNVMYSQNTHNSRDSAFLYDCRGCSDCTSCSGLRNKRYYVFNKPYSKNDYYKIIQELKLNTWCGAAKMKEEFNRFVLNFPRRASIIINSEDCSGDNIVDAKNCVNSFDVDGPAQDMKDTLFCGAVVKDIMSSDHVGVKSEMIYEVTNGTEAYYCALSISVWYSRDIFYSEFISNSHDLFACTNMNRAQYCILNKQYPKEEYEKLRCRIIEHMKKTGEWGEFFPPQFSLFGYNETVANDYYPLLGSEVIERGWPWFDEEKKNSGNNEFIPDAIEDVDENVLQKSLVCEISGRPYKIIPQELAFYRTHKIPIPRHSPETRNKMRLAMRTPRQLWQRTCSQCNVQIAAPYPPQWPEKILCEPCYLAILG